MGSHDDDPSNLIRPSILLFVIGSAILVVSVYHCIAARWCRPRPNPPEPRRASGPEDEYFSSFENSGVQLIPAHKYSKSETLAGRDGTCSICLSEFEEGDELRTLPECAHSFHAPCIDMWLYSHASCPICRADATPSRPQIFPSSTSLLGNIDRDRDRVMLEHVVVHSEL